MIGWCGEIKPADGGGPTARRGATVLLKVIFLKTRKQTSLEVKWTQTVAYITQLISYDS